MQLRPRPGQTPSKPQRPDLVETPAPRRKQKGAAKTPAPAAKMSSATPADEGTQTARQRKKTPLDALNEEKESPVLVIGDTKEKSAEDATADGNANKDANGNANGHTKDKPSEGATEKTENGQPKVIDGWIPGRDPKIDYSGEFEFGGSIGTSMLMIGFPLLMYYMWIGATYYDGGLPLPKDEQTMTEFLAHLGNLVYQGAYPSLKAWAMYWIFFIFEALCYVYLPGITLMGRPLPHENGKQLPYYCSAVSSFYVTLLVASGLHLSGLFKLYTIIDEFGPLLSVAIISGFLVSIVAYFSALLRGAQHRMTGYPIYDFFMGAELNPRIGLLDFKMFFEVRLPWYILLLLSMGTAARQYELYGYVSGEVCFLVMAHFLYANACSKGEECIISTWDMYYEKWGFMLIFWNLAGVPLSYCHCTIYLANHHPDTYRWNPYALTALFAGYLFVYWVWDTANSQKNRFRQMERGTTVFRNAFPQLPWQTVHNPEVIRSPQGTILVSGWYGLARKVHYTCDLYFALNWGLITWFNSPFPWFYPVFFACMISHRCWRDVQRCRLKYGDAWTAYERKVPHLFIPYVI